MTSKRKVTLEEARAVFKKDLGERMAKLRVEGKEPRSVSEALREVGTPAGQARVAAHLASEPFPHFEAAPGRPGFLVKLDADGTRTVDRFVRRTFTPVKDE
jgi:hypothetical protein